MVGATSAYAIMMRKAASEIVVIDANPKRAEAEAADIQHAVPFVQQQMFTQEFMKIYMMLKLS